MSSLAVFGCAAASANPLDDRGEASTELTIWDPGLRLGGEILLRFEGRAPIEG